MSPGRGRKTLILVLASLVGLGPGSLAQAGDRYAAAILAQGELPEEQLLDVAIELLSPSIDDYDREALTEKGIQPSVRKAEARYIPIHLRDTLQSTGQWGAVRVVPGGVPWAGLNVVGKIEKSNGKDLKITIKASDATGREWLDEDYSGKARLLTYASETVEGLDPFQSVYNEIANDLVEARSKRKKKDLVRIQKVAELRFAAEFAPDTFGPYLQTDRKGRYKVSRLPSADDPMMLRLELIRERDDMFVDTLNEYYSDFFARMDKPYDDWRANSYTEQAAYDSLNKSGNLKKILGIAAIAAGIFVPANSRAASDAKTIAIIAGTAAVQSGFKDSADSQIHKSALEELAESFGADVSELVVDVDGRIIELKGSAEEQFQQWRALLKEIAFADVALPVDINVTAVPAPPAEAAPPAPPAMEPVPPSSPEPVFVTPADSAAPPLVAPADADTTATPSHGL
jgi:hypothetical protein